MIRIAMRRAMDVWHIYCCFPDLGGQMKDLCTLSSVLCGVKGVMYDGGVKGFVGCECRGASK